MNLSNLFKVVRLLCVILWEPYDVLCRSTHFIMFYYDLEKMYNDEWLEVFTYLIS
jgi:hypothetical protein